MKESEFDKQAVTTATAGYHSNLDLQKRFTYRYHCPPNSNTPFKSSKIAAKTIENDNVWCNCPKFHAALVILHTRGRLLIHPQFLLQSPWFVQSLCYSYIWFSKFVYRCTNLDVERKFEYANFEIGISGGNSIIRISMINRETCTLRITRSIERRCS